MAFFSLLETGFCALVHIHGVYEGGLDVKLNLRSFSQSENVFVDGFMK